MQTAVRMTWIQRYGTQSQREEALRADLRGIKKETTSAGNIRFVGETGDSHCDRFWAKALAVHASGKRQEFSSALI